LLHHGWFKIAVFPRGAGPGRDQRHGAGEHHRFVAGGQKKPGIMVSKGTIIPIWVWINTY